MSVTVSSSMLSFPAFIMLSSVFSHSILSTARSVVQLSEIEDPCGKADLDSCPDTQISVTINFST